jgi:hypothetical protein
MNIKLIPVIELFRISDKVKLPDKGPYWEYANEWEEYNRQSLEANGFSEIEPYSKGSNFYELSKINDSDLLLQIKYRTEGWKLDEICPFDGGYILNVNGEDLLYPQCCGDLGDIGSWIELSKGDSRLLWQGHPWPIIKIKKDKILFDLTVGEFDEHFVPVPLKEKFEIDRFDLKSEIDNVMKDLNEIAVKLNDINNKEKLGFENLAKILIWENI